MLTAFVLLLGPLIWGAGFVATKVTLGGSGPLWANCVRFALAILVLFPMALPRLRRRGRRALRAGVLLGVFLFLAFTCQTAGMVTTGIAHSSFITGLYAVFVPLFGPFFGRHPKLSLLGATALALAGLALLTGVFSASAHVSPGDLLILGCAIVSAIHILIADRVAKEADSIALNWIQLATVAVISLGTAFALEGAPHITWSRNVVVGQLYLAIFSSGLAFTLQFWAQRRISPTVAAMIFLLEAPFGAAAGAAIYGERLSLVQMLGGMLMLVACYLAVITGEREPEITEPAATSLRETGL